MAILGYGLGQLLTRLDGSAQIDESRLTLLLVVFVIELLFECLLFVQLLLLVLVHVLLVD